MLAPGQPHQVSGGCPAQGPGAALHPIIALSACQGQTIFASCVLEGTFLPPKERVFDALGARIHGGNSTWCWLFHIPPTVSIQLALRSHRSKRAWWSALSRRCTRIGILPAYNKHVVQSVVLRRSLARRCIVPTGIFLNWRDFALCLLIFGLGGAQRCKGKARGAHIARVATSIPKTPRCVASKKSEPEYGGREDCMTGFPEGACSPCAALAVAGTRVLFRFGSESCLGQAVKSCPPQFLDQTYMDGRQLAKAKGFVHVSFKRNLSFDKSAIAASWRRSRLLHIVKRPGCA